MTHPYRTNRDLAIEVPDLAAAEAFYGGVLGYAAFERGDGWIGFETGSFCLYVNLTRDKTLSFVPSLDVPDAAAAWAQLAAAGCTLERGDPKLGGFWFRDPFGFVVDVVERKTGR